MLVLSRKKEDKIHIGENIVITVLAVKVNSVKIGIDAPRHISIIRGELVDTEDGAPHTPTPLPAPPVETPDA